MYNSLQCYHGRRRAHEYTKSPISGSIKLASDRNFIFFCLYLQVTHPVFSFPLYLVLPITQIASRAIERLTTRSANGNNIVHFLHFFQYRVVEHSLSSPQFVVRIKLNEVSLWSINLSLIAHQTLHRRDCDVSSEVNTYSS